MNDPDFQRYLQAKKTVDDRALNRFVWQALETRLPDPVRMVEIGCGVGTMYQRMCDWGLITSSPDYLGIDADPKNIDHARQTNFPGKPNFECLDFYALKALENYDLITAAAFLDLVDLDTALPKIRSLLAVDGLAYFPINFDGITIFEPAHPYDQKVIDAYHGSMDARPSGGGSRTGRKLFEMLPAYGFEILAAGSSDWILFPGTDRQYPDDEAFFLQYLLGLFEKSCAGAEGLEDWLSVRREQVQKGQLSLVVHQLDFLARK